MEKKTFILQFAGFIFTSVAGVLLHFLYDWTGGSIFAAIISGVNESIWEHIKLLFFPLFIFAFAEKHFLKEQEGFWCVKLYGTLTGTALIPVIYYTFNGAFGKSPDWLNIAIFFIAAAAVYIAEYFMFKNGKVRCLSQNIAFMSLCIIGAVFIIFTFFTPHLPIFQDPITGLYGIF